MSLLSHMSLTRSVRNDLMTCKLALLWQRPSEKLKEQAETDPLYC